MHAVSMGPSSLIQSSLNCACWSAQEELRLWAGIVTQLGLSAENLPPLPCNIEAIMKGPCPIYSRLLVEDTHVLVPILKEFQNLEHFISLVEEYGWRAYQGQANPLLIWYFKDVVKTTDATRSFPESHWVLLTKKMLPNSRAMPWDAQVRLVDGLNKDVSVRYQIPALQHLVVFGMLHMMKEDDTLSGTRIQEAGEHGQLVVGRFIPPVGEGLYVRDVPNDLRDEDIGLAAIRTFSVPVPPRVLATSC